MLRPREFTVDGGSDGAGARVALLAAPTTRRPRALFGAGIFEAGLLPF
jgi:hypothetical protein